MSDEHDRRMREIGAKLWATTYGAEFEALRSVSADENRRLIPVARAHAHALAAAEKALAELVDRFGSL